VRLIAAVAVLAALAAVPAAAGDRARLRLVKTQPVTIHGSGFHTHERVGAVLRRRDGVSRRSGRADADGEFSLSFRGANVARCDGFRVVATGADGSRAALMRRPPIVCSPP
jgi:hypothetical protein